MFAVCTARLTNCHKLLVAVDGTTHIITYEFHATSSLSKVDMFEPFLGSQKKKTQRERERERENLIRCHLP